MVTGNYSLLYVTVSVKQIIAKVKLKPIAYRTDQNEPHYLCKQTNQVTRSRLIASRKHHLGKSMRVKILEHFEEFQDYGN